MFLSEKIFIFENNREFIVLMLFITSFFLIGLYDDKFNLKPINKIIFSNTNCDYMYSN